MIVFTTATTSTHLNTQQNISTFPSQQLHFSLVSQLKCLLCLWPACQKEEVLVKMITRDEYCYWCCLALSLPVCPLGGLGGEVTVVQCEVS